MSQPTCRHCRKTVPPDSYRCPHCNGVNPRLPAASEKPSVVASLILLAVVLGIVYGAIRIGSAVFDDREPTPNLTAQQEIDACVERGVAYFKEIGSYPTLTAPMYEGRKADDEARARCGRTTTAF